MECAEESIRNATFPVNYSYMTIQDALFHASAVRFIKTGNHPTEARMGRLMFSDFVRSFGNSIKSEDADGLPRYAVEDERNGVYIPGPYKVIAVFPDENLSSGDLRLGDILINMLG